MSTCIHNDAMPWTEPGDAFLAPGLASHGAVAGHEGATPLGPFFTRRAD